MANGGQPQQGSTNPVNPNAPALDMGPSLVQTGITMMASGMADDGTITPGSAQALSNLGQGIAHRMQDRWWKQEFENFQSTKGAEVKLQAQRTAETYNVKLQDSAKIKDPQLRMQSMNETHGWAVNQMATLDQQYLDMSAQYPNNPYIGNQANQLLQQRREQWQALASGPEESAKTVGAQEQAMGAAADTQLKQQEVADQPLKEEATRAGLEQTRAQTKLLGAQTSYYEGKAATAGTYTTPLDKVMPDIIRATKPADKLGIIMNTKGGKEAFEGLIENRMSELEENMAEDYLAYSQADQASTSAKTPETRKDAEQARKSIEEAFSQKYGIYPDEAGDKEGNLAFAKYKQSNYTKIRDTVLTDLQTAFQSKYGSGASPEGTPSVRPTPIIIRPGEKKGGIEYRDSNESTHEPTAAAKAWGIEEGTPDEAGNKAININQNVQKYFEQQNQDAPAPFDVTQMDAVLAETGKSYDELITARPGKPLPPKERDIRVKKLAEKAKQVLQTPEDVENRDYRINKGLLHLAVQYSQTTGKPVSVDKFLEEALGMAAMKPEEIKAKSATIREDIAEINKQLLDPSKLEQGQAQKLQALRDKKFDQLEAMGEPSTPLRAGIKGAKKGAKLIAGAWNAARTEQERQKSESQTKLKRLLEE